MMLEIKMFMPSEARLQNFQKYCFGGTKLPFRGVNLVEL